MNNKAFDRCRWLYQGALSAILLAVPVIPTKAQDYNISARNTSLEINVGGSDPGLSDWMVDGVNELNYQWFYYSVGNSTLSSIDNLASWTTPTVTGTYSPPLGAITVTNLSETYANSTLSLTTKYTLNSSTVGSGTASLATQITLQNLTDSQKTISFYQFSDFWLGGVSGGQNVQFMTTNSPYQVIQTGAAASLTGKLTSVALGLNGSVEEVAGNGGDQFNLANGNTPPSFNDSNLSAGPGNVTYAYEFTVTLAADGDPGSSLSISELQSVPEPSSLALISSGMLGLALFYGRGLNFFKKSKKEL